MNKKREIIFKLLRGTLAIGIAMAVGMLLIFISAPGDGSAAKFASTGNALRQMLVGPLFRIGKNGMAFEAKRLADVLAMMIPITFTGLAVCIMFSANQFNMGAEGGIFLGAFASSMVAIYMPMPPFLHAVVAVIVGGIAAGAMMLLPAVLKAKWNVSEMVCSLMLNSIVQYIVKFLMNGYFADKTRGQIQTLPFCETSLIAPISSSPAFVSAKLTWGFLVALVFVALCWVFMYRTRWGYMIRMIGINRDFAKYSGMKVAFIIVLSQVAGGLLSGIGGGIETLGRYTTFRWQALPGYGWTGVTIAILAGNNPAFVPLAAFLMAYLTKGCDLMAAYAKVPSQLIDIVQGVIFVFYAAEQFLAGYRQKLVVATAKEEMAKAKT